MSFCMFDSDEEAVNNPVLGGYDQILSSSAAMDFVEYARNYSGDSVVFSVNDWLIVASLFHVMGRWIKKQDLTTLANSLLCCCDFGSS